MSHSASTLGFATTSSDIVQTVDTGSGAARRGFTEICRIVLSAMSDGYAASHRYQVMRAQGEPREKAAMAALAEIGPRE